MSFNNIEYNNYRNEWYGIVEIRDNPEKAAFKGQKDKFIDHKPVLQEQNKAGAKQNQRFDPQFQAGLHWGRRRRGDSESESERNKEPGQCSNRFEYVRFGT